jgi:hypothetical protein
MLGVHGNGLTALVWMKPTPRSTVMEFFYPGGFAHDYEYTTRALGMVHFGFWGHRYVSVFCRVVLLFLTRRIATSLAPKCHQLPILRAFKGTTFPSTASWWRVSCTRDCPCQRKRTIKLLTPHIFIPRAVYHLDPLYSVACRTERTLTYFPFI